MSMCSACAHDGQCEGLPYCGGRYFERDENGDALADDDDSINDYDPDEARDYQSYRLSYDY